MESQLSYLKSLKIMLWKCYTQYASKFGKLRGGHRIGKGQFSFQSQRRAMPRNVQTTIQLLSFHRLARLCSKSCKLGLSSMWTENVQMYKLGREKAEEPDVRARYRKGRGTRDQIDNIRWIIEKAREFQKTSTSASLITPKPLSVWVTMNCRKFLKR